MKSQFSISEKHPSLAGHFPNNPIIPGAVILDEIIQTIKSNSPGKTVSKIIAAKFVRPLRAGQEVTLIIEEKTKAIKKFICTCNNEVIVTGQCEVSDKDTA